MFLLSFETLVLWEGRRQVLWEGQRQVQTAGANGRYKRQVQMAGASGRRAHQENGDWKFHMINSYIYLITVYRLLPTTY